MRNNGAVETIRPSSRFGASGSSIFSQVARVAIVPINCQVRWAIERAWCLTKVTSHTSPVFWLTLTNPASCRGSNVTINNKKLTFLSRYFKVLIVWLESCELCYRSSHSSKFDRRVYTKTDQKITPPPNPYGWDAFEEDSDDTEHSRFVYFHKLTFFGAPPSKITVQRWILHWISRNRGAVSRQGYYRLGYWRYKQARKNVTFFGKITHSFSQRFLETRLLSVLLLP